MKPVLAVLAGALALAWPAIWNGYPILFSDTAAFLEQAAQPDAVFDKPWAYGPFLLALHGQTTLWLPMAAQALILSQLLYLVNRVLGGAILRFALICAVLALGSAAPWFASLLMPDIFAPITVLCLFLLGWKRDDLGRWERRFVAVLGAFAIAAHLTHLIVAGACCAVIAVSRCRMRAAIWPALRPLIAAVLWLVVVNAAVWGRPGLSPFGSVFLLARLVADGPAVTTLHEACPQAGWRLCAWGDRLPSDSDAFLWAPEGPVWAGDYGPTLLAPEASRIIRQTIITQPVAVANAMARNTGRQLLMIGLGDTLHPRWLDVSVGAFLRAHFPPEEAARFGGSRQMGSTLHAPLSGLRHALLWAGLAGTLAVLIGGNGGLRGLAALCLIGLLANAFATGALSGPHDRYQARIAWLLLLVPLLTVPLLAGSGRAARQARLAPGNDNPV